MRMKKKKNVTLDEEVLKKLNEELNASALINAILRKRYALIDETCAQNNEKKTNVRIEKRSMSQDFDDAFGKI
jgi:hypothetical protein